MWERVFEQYTKELKEKLKCREEEKIKKSWKSMDKA